MGGRGNIHTPKQRETILELINEAVTAGARLFKACKVIGLSVRTIGRWKKAENGGIDGRKGAAKSPANKLSKAEHKELLKVVNSSELSDLSPKQIVPRLADEGKYLASESTMYRVLRKEGMMKHRGKSKAPVPQPAEVVAHGPDELWSWDITYLSTQVKGKFMYLYLFMDVWSRKIVGWEVHQEESMEHSSALVERLCASLKDGGEGLLLHSDNGSPMRGSTMKATLERLGVMASFSRPGVSDDNPYSESLFKTFKYRPDYQANFENLATARQWVSDFVQWYNFEHFHSSIAFVTPAARHNGDDKAQLAFRRKVYKDARQRHPERFPNGTRAWLPASEVTLHRRGPKNKPLTHLLKQPFVKEEHLSQQPQCH